MTEFIDNLLEKLKKVQKCYGDKPLNNTKLTQALEEVEKILRDNEKKDINNRFIFKIEDKGRLKNNELDNLFTEIKKLQKNKSQKEYDEISKIVKQIVQSFNDGLFNAHTELKKELSEFIKEFSNKIKKVKELRHYLEKLQIKKVKEPECYSKKPPQKQYQKLKEKLEKLENDKNYIKEKTNNTQLSEKFEELKKIIQELLEISNDHEILTNDNKRNNNIINDIDKILKKPHNKELLNELAEATRKHISKSKNNGNCRKIKIIEDLIQNNREDSTSVIKQKLQKIIQQIEDTKNIEDSTEVKALKEINNTTNDLLFDECLKLVIQNKISEIHTTDDNKKKLKSFLSNISKVFDGLYSVDEWDEISTEIKIFSNNKIKDILYSEKQSNKIIESFFKTEKEETEVGKNIDKSSNMNKFEELKALYDPLIKDKNGSTKSCSFVEKIDRNCLKYIEKSVSRNKLHKIKEVVELLYINSNDLVTKYMAKIVKKILDRNSLSQKNIKEIESFVKKEKLSDIDFPKVKDKDINKQRVEDYSVEEFPIPIIKYMIEGIRLATVKSNIKYKDREDLLLVVFDKKAISAGVFAKSSFPASSVKWCKKVIKEYDAKAFIVNAGNANSFTGEKGEEATNEILSYLSKSLNCNKEEILISSTGVTGKQLPYNLILQKIPNLISNLSNDEENWENAAKSIMTTDTFHKISQDKCKIENETTSIIGFAKGSGMIAPNMATMLAYIFTDANISKKLLQKLLIDINEETFNSITVDSDASTNDTVLLFSTQKAKHKLIENYNNISLKDFKEKLRSVMLSLAKKIILDGEGANRLIEINIVGMESKDENKKIALSIANSPLVKTAINGADPNWGRIIMAIGKTGIKIEESEVNLEMGNMSILKDGELVNDFQEENIHKYILENKEIKIRIKLGDSNNSTTVWTCDLSEKYIEINSDYLNQT